MSELNHELTFNEDKITTFKYNFYKHLLPLRGIVDGVIGKDSHIYELLDKNLNKMQENYEKIANLKFRILDFDSFKIDDNILNNKISYYENNIEKLFKKYVAIHSLKDPIYKKIDILSNDFKLNKGKIIDYIKQQSGQKY